MARDLDGSSNYISYSLNTEQNNLTTFSFAGWFYFDSNSQYRRLVQKGPAYPDMDWDLEWDDSWGLVFQYGKWSTASGAWSITKPGTGAWAHIAVTYDGGSTTNDPQIYVNGIAASVTERNTPSGTYSNAQSGFYLGTDSGAGEYHDGRLAEVAMWDVLLSAAEVALLGDGFAPSFIGRGLVWYAPLVRSTGDIVGSGSATLSGTTVISHPRIIYPAKPLSIISPSVAAAVTSIQDIISMGFIPFAR